MVTLSCTQCSTNSRGRRITSVRAMKRYIGGKCCVVRRRHCLCGCVCTCMTPKPHQPYVCTSTMCISASQHMSVMHNNNNKPAVQRHAHGSVQHVIVQPHSHQWPLDVLPPVIMEDDDVTIVTCSSPTHQQPQSPAEFVSQTDAVPALAIQSWQVLLPHPHLPFVQWCTIGAAMALLFGRLVSPP